MWHALFEQDCFEKTPIHAPKQGNLLRGNVNWADLA
jgi:hypothetical protein